MKGDSGAAIVVVVLIIVGIVALFLYFGNQGISFFGFWNVQPIVYSNDVVTVSDNFVSDKVPYEGQRTTIEFTVRNNGKGIMDGKNGKGPVEVSLDPPTGFTSSVKCGDKPSCKFDLDEGEAVDVVVTLTAISGITQIIPVDVRYSVNYPYAGEREIHIPIVSSKNELPKGQSSFTSDPTFGPIQVSITPPAARQVSDGGSAIFTITGAKEEDRIPVELGFRVDNVGSGGFGTVEPLLMSGDDLKLALTNFKTDFCDKIDPATNTLKVKESVNPDLVSSGQEVPFDVSCTFEPTSTESVADGVIKINYKYNYKISFSEQFSILPKGVPKIEAPQPTAPTAGVATLRPGTSESYEESKQLSFEVKENSKVTLKMTPGGGYNYDLYVRWDKSAVSSKEDVNALDPLAFCAPKSVTPSSSETCQSKTLGPGTYYAYVYRGNIAGGREPGADDYKIEFSMVASSEPPLVIPTKAQPTLTDAPDKIENALSLGAITGTAARSDSITAVTSPRAPTVFDKDYFSFEMEAGKKYTIKTTGCDKSGADTSIVVYTKTSTGQVPIGTNDDSGGGTCSTVIIQAPTKEGGVRYILVTGTKAGEYALEVTKQ